MTCFRGLEDLDVKENVIKEYRSYLHDKDRQQELRRWRYHDVALAFAGKKQKQNKK